MKKILGAAFVLLFLLFSFNAADAIFDGKKAPRGTDWAYINAQEKKIYIEAFKEGVLYVVANYVPLLSKNLEVADEIKKLVVDLMETKTDTYIKQINEWYDMSDRYLCIPINNMITLVFQQFKYKINKQVMMSILDDFAKQYNKK